MLDYEAAGRDHGPKNGPFDSPEELAQVLGMTPATLRAEMQKFPKDVPVYLYHMKPPSLSRIRREVAALAEPRLRLIESERSFRF